MTQRSNPQPRFQTDAQGVGPALRLLADVRLLALVLLITVQTGAGMGFA